jgi:hypothetical protein
MTEDEQERRRAKPKWLWFSLAAVVALLAVLIVPPLVSVSRYKSQITNLIGQSLGRPARLSSVHVRLLPRPGFVLYDLVVDDNPAFGAEPVIHASSVTAPIRFLPLWRGRLEISEISVDEASLNLVRTPDGKWNLDSLLEKTATNVGKMGADTHRAAFPRLVATNSRINFKRGVEKLPYSLIDTDLSLWQSNPGEWRLRLRGQPARTDVNVNPADTGILELDATAQQTADLRKMPIHLDLDWRDAQLGQLSRLTTGSDAGWRGDLRGEVHMDGTSENAQIKTRLRATGVHRAEFAPAEPMDFDANCTLVYHYSKRTLEDVACDSPLGSGRIRVAGEMNNSGHLPRYSVEMIRVPLAAGLEALRTVRSGVDPNLTAAGAISGKVMYDETPTPLSTQKIAEAAGRSKMRSGKGSVSTAGPLAGSFTVEGFQLNGGGLSKPLTVAKVVIAPTVAVPGHTQGLATTFAIPAGAPVPLTLDLHLAFRSYLLTARGQVSAQRAREIAHATGLPGAAALDQLAGEALLVDLTAQGPWLPVRDAFFTPSQPEIAAAGIVRGIVSTAGGADVVDPAADSLTGTVTLHNANWKADYLANHVEISDATLHVVSGELHWDPVNFIYGPLKGTATLTVPKTCDTVEPCETEALPNFNVRFSNLDAATMQTAVLGAKVKGTMVSDLLARLRPSAPPVWPKLQGTVSADSLILGPVTLEGATVQLYIAPTGIEITALNGKMLGGSLHATGTLVTGDKPEYTINADLIKLNPTAVGQLLGQTWRSGTLNANGKIELAGFTRSDLAKSAKGTLHFEWRGGTATGSDSLPELARFDSWMGDADINEGKVTLGKNELAHGSRKQTVAASVVLAEPVKLSFEAADSPKPGKAELAKKR